MQFFFVNGKIIYNNSEGSEIDWCGFDYYSPKQVEEMVEAIEDKKPKDYQVVLEWLDKAEEFNGVYIIGL